MMGTRRRRRAWEEEQNNSKNRNINMMMMIIIIVKEVKLVVCGLILYDDYINTKSVGSICSHSLLL
jgi:hypothetical protein